MSWKHSRQHLLKVSEEFKKNRQQMSRLIFRLLKKNRFFQTFNGKSIKNIDKSFIT